ncbi:hypothetical protein I4U23_017388 [Adineta vaga]|nr:hypothetical protein I4U23_017388 [Adineta vaga]
MSDVADKKYEKWLCRRCFWQLYPPYQLNCCGERICGACVEFDKDTEWKCPSCSFVKPDTTLDQGYRREIEKEEINCSECGSSWKGLLKDLRKHLETHAELQCIHCKKAFVNKFQLEFHEQYRCIHRTVSCPLVDYGCSNKIPYSKSEQHRLSNEHQNSVLSCVEQLCIDENDESGIFALQNRIKEENQHNLEEYQQRVESIIQEILLVSNDCNDVNSKRQMMETVCAKIWEELRKNNEPHANIIKLRQNIEEIFSAMNKLIEDIQNKNNTSVKVMDSNDVFLLKVALMVLLNDELPTVQSGPIQSTQFGYRFGFTVSSRMDEYTNIPYIQISFAIFRGDYDAILFWPFPYSIKISLMDLSGEKNDIFHWIAPDSQSAIFDKPQNATNPPYQIPRFCATEKLTKPNSPYVRDGNIFVQLHINYEETNSFLYNSNNYEQSGLK